MDLERKWKGGVGMTAYSDDVLSTLAQLVSINSINPAYDQGKPEEDVAKFIEGFFSDRGIETFRQEVSPGRSNVIARLPGHNSERRVVLEAHMDTASITGMTIPPFDPVIRDGLLYGRGACDTKGGLAAMMHAVAFLKQNRITPPCEVWLAAVVDEEFAFQGAIRLCEGLQAHAAIIAEPTELRAVVASKGVLRWKIRTHGKAAHSSKPHLGVNAISHMAAVVDAIDRETVRLSETKHPLLGPATANVGIVRGGVQVNFVPDRCEIEVDRRLLPSESIDGVLNEYSALLAALDKSKTSLKIEMDSPMIADAAFETDVSEAVVTTAQSVLQRMGLDATPAGVPFGSDASKLSRHGVPSIIFGPGSIDLAHGAVEYVECDQVALATTFYRGFLMEFA